MDPLINDQAVRLLTVLSANLSLLLAALIGLLISLAVWRRLRYGSWPGAGECAGLGAGVLALYMAVLAMTVLTFTSPPRFEFLSPLHLKGAGLYTMILTLYHALPGLKKLFAPAAPAAPPESYWHRHASPVRSDVPISPPMSQ